MLLYIASAIAVLFLILWCSITKDFQRKGNTVIEAEYPLMFYLKILRALYHETKNRPLAAVLLQYMCAGYEVLREYKLGVFELAFKRLVFFFKPESVEILLKNSSVIDKSQLYRFLQPWLGHGLITSSGERWRHRRKLLTPAFHFKILEDFLPVFNEQSTILVSKIQDLSTKKPFVDIVPLVLACALDIICETAMGIHTNAQGSENNYCKSITQISESLFHRAVRPWLHPDFIYRFSPSGKQFYKNIQTIQDFNWKIIKEKKAEFLARSVEEKPEGDEEDHKRKRCAFLELLLEHHLKDGSLSEEDVAQEVHTFMFGGHDTTAMSISWVIYFLGLYQTVQQKVIDELDDIFEDDAADREITREDLSRMKYLECVIKETLRLYPTVPFFAREVQEPFKVDDFTLEKGCTCFVFIWGIHRDRKFFPEPDKFIPERFLPENSIGRHPYSYIPFSAGPRNCIGQKFAFLEEKIVLSHIFRRFRAHSLDPRDRVEIKGSLIARNLDPLRIRFTPR